MTQHYAYYDSPIGQMLLTASASALTGLHFVGEKYYPSISSAWRQDENFIVIKTAMAQLDEYFAAQRISFELCHCGFYHDEISILSPCRRNTGIVFFTDEM